MVELRCFGAAPLLPRPLVAGIIPSTECRVSRENRVSGVDTDSNSSYSSQKVIAFSHDRKVRVS
jgi:hypothetical protein